MNGPVQCPVCLSQDGFQCVAQPFGSRDATLFECDVCGRFAIAQSALDDQELRQAGWTKVRRAALSHNLRLSTDKSRDVRLLTTYDIDGFLSQAASLPSPAAQSLNIIRYIGDRVSRDGSPIQSLGSDFGAAVGSPDREFALSLLFELVELRLVSGMRLPDVNNPAQCYQVSLTLRGWERYEAERAGQLSGAYGFIALKFNDRILDPLLRDHIKPAIKRLGFDAYDMRDVAEAGIIDNLLRVRIRDAAFVIVDLTHENAGAYWEAGYAEGLGKPVLYICEKKKFEEKQTHFDTNHCTTVLWDADDVEPFLGSLLATLRRSLAI